MNAERWCLKGGEFRATNIRTRKETLETLIKDSENRPKKKKLAKPEVSKDRIASPNPTRPEPKELKEVKESDPNAATGSPPPLRSSSSFTKLIDDNKRGRSNSSGTPNPSPKMKGPSREAVANVANSPREFRQEKIDKIISCARILATASQVEPFKFDSSEFREKLYQLVSNTVATFTGTDKQLEHIIDLAKSLSETGSEIIVFQEKRKNPELIDALEAEWKKKQSEFGNKLVSFIRAINSTVSVDSGAEKKEQSSPPSEKVATIKIERPIETIGKTTLEIASLLSKAEFDGDEFGKHMRLICMQQSTKFFFFLADCDLLSQKFSDDAVKEIAATCEESKSRLLLDTVKPLLQKGSF